MRIGRSNVDKSFSKSPPTTMDRNNSRTPIDSIWTTPGVEIKACGYLPFGAENSCESDHRLVWIEVDNTAILGKNPPELYVNPKTKIKSNEPKNREKYIKMVKREYHREDIFKKADVFTNYLINSILETLRLLHKLKNYT